MDTKGYSIRKEVNLGYAEAIDKVTAELKKEGFGILTEIDVKATMKEKLDVDLEPYMILGACNPPFALKALTAEPDVGLMMPCNVIVYLKDGKTIVAAINPMVAMAVVQNDSMADFAEQVTQKLVNVINRL
jgi:uncharacterized protein (DUF302 family)